MPEDTRPPAGDATAAPAPRARRGDRPGEGRPGEAAPGGADPGVPKPGERQPGEGTPGPETPAAPRRGADLARAVLDAAKARPAPKRRRTIGGRAAGAGRAWSGAGPDARDPQPFGSLLDKLVKNRGWQRPAAEATLFGQWEKVVGQEVAEHCRPVKLQDGELTIEATSTAWATQLRLLAGSLIKQIAGQVGHNLVTKLRIHGPAAPTWNRGPRRVRGRGPRDTYG